MNKFLVCTLATLVSFAAFAVDEAAKWDPNMANSSAKVDTNGVKWIDGKFLPIEGRWTLGDTAHYYSRLPDAIEQEKDVNGGVKSMRKNTAGMQFRFRTDSKFLVIRFKSLSGKYVGSVNMTGVATDGWDLYRQAKGSAAWHYACSSHVSSPCKDDSKAMIKRIGWTPGEACCINLALYGGVQEFALGIDPKATISAAKHGSGVEKPVVFYGTSITHGASASRPGLSFVNIVGRELDVPVYNLGFSGCGRMEYPMGDYLAKIDASCYVLDCLWNMATLKHPDNRPGCSNKIFEKNYEPLIRNLRKQRPGVPIVMAEQCDVRCGGPNEKDMMMKALYKKLLAEGWTELYYLPKDEMYSGDGEGTVEGCHPNDLGMRSLATAFGKAVREALKLK